MQFSPYFRRIVGLPRAVLRTGNHVRYVVNRDDLVGKVPWITGVKTGHTSGAGYVLVSSGTFRGMTLIGAVLGTSSEAARDANALALMRWGFENYRQADPVTAGAVIARPTINGGTSRATVIAGGSFARAVLKSDRITLTNSLPRNLNGPLARHAVVGHETVRINGRPVRRIPLLLARAIPGLSPLTQASRFARRPITLVVLVLAIGVAATLLAARRRRPTPAV
jgi:D-alanyl-D-alanine carboxypeptidase (penicillin-binding protein 5/6)